MPAVPVPASARRACDPVGACALFGTLARLLQIVVRERASERARTWGSQHCRSPVSLSSLEVLALTQAGCVIRVGGGAAFRDSASGVSAGCARLSEQCTGGPTEPETL